MTTLSDHSPVDVLIHADVPNSLVVTVPLVDMYNHTNIMSVADDTPFNYALSELISPYTLALPEYIYVMISKNTLVTVNIPLVSSVVANL